MAEPSNVMNKPVKKKSKKQVGKQPFKAEVSLPKAGVPKPPQEDDFEEMQNRVPPHAFRPAPAPQKLRRAVESAGLTFKPELPDQFRHAAHRQGRPLAEKLMITTTQKLVKKGVRFGSGDFDPEEEEEEAEVKALVGKPFTDTQMRQAFSTYDLNGNDFVDAAELKHVFALCGEIPTDNEISAMIMLCDPRGDGTVNFDDFLNVFTTPAESLRNANIKGIKHLLPRKKVDFDVRDPLGIVLEEKSRVKERWCVVSEVRKGSQAQDAGVKNGWKVISVEGELIKLEREFNAAITKLEKAAVSDDEDGAQIAAITGAKGGGKSKAKPKDEAEPKKKKLIKYDYSIIFEVLPGIDDTSSSEEELLPEELEEEEKEDEDEDED